MARVVAVATLALTLAACSSGPVELPSPPAGSPSLTVTSEQFTNGDLIRPRYTCDGIDISPEIGWTEGPDGTETYVVLLDDPDAAEGRFTHWLTYDLPPRVRGLIEGAGGAFGALPEGGAQGMSDFGLLGYKGPCPPEADDAHGYVLHVYAMDTTLGLRPQGERDEVLSAMAGHVLAEGTLTGTYARTEHFEDNKVFRITPTP